MENQVKFFWAVRDLGFHCGNHRIGKNQVSVSWLEYDGKPILAISTTPNEENTSRIPVFIHQETNLTNLLTKTDKRREIDIVDFARDFRTCFDSPRTAKVAIHKEFIRKFFTIINLESYLRYFVEGGFGDSREEIQELLSGCYRRGINPLPGLRKYLWGISVRFCDPQGIEGKTVPSISHNQIPILYIEWINDEDRVELHWFPPSL